MRKQTRALAEIGVAYLTVSIVLDYLLGAYQILLWPALAFGFILFGIMIFATLWEHPSPAIGKRELHTPETDDKLIRLQHLCKLAIDDADNAAERLLSERVRSIAFAAAAYNLNTSETRLRFMAIDEPNLLQTKIVDRQFFSALTTEDAMIQKGDSRWLEKLLDIIEGWTT
jgi:hypothetical protein